MNSIAPGFVRSNAATERQWESLGADGQRALVASMALRAARHAGRHRARRPVLRVGLCRLDHGPGALPDDVLVLADGRAVAEGPVAALRLAGVRRIRATLTGATVEAVHPLLVAVPGLEDVDVTAAPGDLVRVSATARGEIDPSSAPLQQRPSET